MTLKQLRLFLLILLLSLLSACSGDTFTDPTPIPPPPTTSGAAATAVPQMTPNPTAVPTSIAVEPTPTLSPTATTTVIDLSPGESDPPVQVITDQPFPAIGRDLLFLADGAFKQWNHATGQIETIVAGADPAERIGEPDGQIRHFIGDITNYSMSADGKRAAVARLLTTETITQTIADGIESSQLITSSYELLFVDMISREVWTLVPNIKYLADIQLSPDAQQLAIVTSTVVTNLDPSLAFEELSEELYLLPTGGGNPGSLQQVYVCSVNCGDLAWHGESNLLAFSDGVALWLYNIAANAPEQLLENQFPTLDATSNADPGLIHSPIAWARNGRYLLIQQGTLNDNTRLVLDIPTGTLSAEAAALTQKTVPDTDFLSEVGWMPDDRLLVVRTSTEPKSLTPIAELWLFDLASGQLVLDESTILSEHPLGVMGSTYLEDGRFAFALGLPPGTFNVPPVVKEAVGTYLLTSFAETPGRVNTLPPTTTPLSGTKVLWAKDGSGALLEKGALFFYAPSNGDYLYEMTAVLGQTPHAFQWQPEIILP